MKKVLNGLGIFGSVILTIMLTLLIFVYVWVLNIKLVVGENGITNTFTRIDIVTALKSSEDGTMWEDFMQLAETLNLSEEQFEIIINNNEFKEQIGGFIENIFSSMLSGEKIQLSKADVENLLNVAVDEYNKISDKKISENKRNEIINSFDEEIINNINESISEINLVDSVDIQYVKYIEMANNILFGSFLIRLLFIIIGIIIFIGLFRFSLYKWMSYVSVSTIIDGIFMLLNGLILLIIPLQNIEIFNPIKNVLVKNIFITAIILFVISICLTISKKYLKKFIENIKSKKEKEAKETGVIKEEECLEKKEKNKKSKVDKKMIIIFILLLIILTVVLFLIFGRKGSYTITFDTNGGSEISTIEVKDGEVVKLPGEPVKEGYTFVGWTNEDGNLLTEGTKLKDDISLKAEWISNDAKTNTVEFDTDGGNVIDSIPIEKGKYILLPVNPIKDGYIFVGWIDENGYVVMNNLIVNENITIKAMWIKKGTKTSTVKFDTDGGNKVESIIVEKGKVVLLPINPTKPGYVFVRWVDEKGNAVTEDTIVNGNITIKATWEEPYACPKGCTPIGDGSECTKTSTKDLEVYSGCPSGMESISTFCTSHQWQVTIGFDEDQTTENAGIICNQGYTGDFCVDYSNRYTHYSSGCPSGYFEYVYSESGLDAVTGCVQKFEKGGTRCPSGYKKDGNKCTKTEIIACEAN